MKNKNRDHNGNAAKLAMVVIVTTFVAKSTSPLASAAKIGIITRVGMVD